MLLQPTKQLIVLLYQGRGPYSNLPFPFNLSTDINIPQASMKLSYRQGPEDDLPKRLTHQHLWNTKAPKCSKIITFWNIECKTFVGYRETEIHKMIDIRKIFYLFLHTKLESKPSIILEIPIKQT